MKKFVKRFLMINLGVFIMGSGLFLFLVPANLAVGGVTGLAMVIQNYFPAVNLGVMMLVFNAILLVLAFIVIGNEFGGYTIYCSFFLSFVIGGFEALMPSFTGIVDDVFLNLTFGIIIQGIGMAIIFYENASTGGTDIIAKILNKFFGIDIGKSLFLADALITLLAGLAFGPELGLYAMLGILVNGLVIDKVIAGFESKISANIVSEKAIEIEDYIHETLKRGTTYYRGIGGYSKSDKNILNVVISRKEYIDLRHQISKIDPDAFISVTFVYEVLGEGFDLRLHSKKLVSN